MAGAALRHPICYSVSPAGSRVPACSGCCLEAGFAWQGQHLGTLSVACVAGGISCSGVFRHVPVAVSGLDLRGRGSALSPARFRVPACSGVFRLLSRG